MTDLTAANTWTARLWALTADVDLSTHQTPTNRDRIRDAILAGAARPVQPEYVPVPSSHVARLAAMAERLGSEEAPLMGLVRRSVSSTLGFARALSDRSADAITSYGTAEYGSPTEDLIARAEEALAGPAGTAADVREATIDAVGLAGIVERVLVRLGVDGWTAVVRDHMSARMAVASAAREVRIRADATVTPTQLRGLVVHEVGTHVLRADDGARQPLQMLARGLPGYLETEEGLATHHEAQVDPRPARLRTFALRVLAADAALHGGIADVMARLTDHTSPAAAFPIALRAKRGMADLTIPGSPLKDVVYLRGLLSVGAHLAANPDDHALLMAGKLGLGDLDTARALQAEGLLSVPAPRVLQLLEEARQPDPPWNG